MTNLWYPSVKESPIQGLTGFGGGVGGNLVSGAAGGGGADSGKHTSAGAVNFWDWSVGHLDYGTAGDLPFTVNTGEVDINDSTLGSGPPNWGSHGVGRYDTKASSSANIYRTAAGKIPSFDWGGAWTFEICFYFVSCRSQMPYAINANTGSHQVYGMVHYFNSGCNVIMDTIGDAFASRLGEANMGTGTIPTNSRWAVFRFIWTGSAWKNETWQDNGSGSWEQKGSTVTTSATSGDQCGPGDGVGSIWLNSFGVHGLAGYGYDDTDFAYMAFYKSDKAGDTPNVVEA